jgi:mono/diheme cytochrome c family protein
LSANLDETKPSYELVVDRVTNGMGAMPAFGGQLDEAQIQDIAAYVVGATGG